MRPVPRLHITGASGTGVTTLAANLAGQLQVTHIDCDDAYWAPTDPPFTAKRPIPERVALIRSAMGAGGWVFSGSCVGWGDGLVADADLVVFLSAPSTVRLDRLRRRERKRYGARIAPGGDMHRIHTAFIDWAAAYDSAGFPGRSRVRHDAWLTQLERPVLRLDGTEQTETLAARVLDGLAQQRAS